MSRSGPIVLVLFLAACQQSAPPPSNTETSELAEGEESRLRPGLYEVTGTETLPGVGTSAERREQKCLDPNDAAHPDRFLVNPGDGCKPGELIKSDGEMRREFRCKGDRVLNFTVTFGSDSWDQAITGTSYQGSYEAHERGQRIGDC